MTQGSLFDAVNAIEDRKLERRMARSTDPDTSHEAAREHVRSGKRAAQAEAVRGAVCRWPGLTSLELAARVDREWLDRFVFARRLPELARAGLVAKGEPRECTVGQRRAVTWWPVGGVS